MAAFRGEPAATTAGQWLPLAPTSTALRILHESHRPPLPSLVINTERECPCQRMPQLRSAAPDQPHSTLAIKAVLRGSPLQGWSSVAPGQLRVCQHSTDQRHQLKTFRRPLPECRCMFAVSAASAVNCSAASACQAVAEAQHRSQPLKASALNRRHFIRPRLI